MNKNRLFLTITVIAVMSCFIFTGCSIGCSTGDLATPDEAQNTTTQAIEKGTPQSITDKTEESATQVETTTAPEDTDSAASSSVSDNKSGSSSSDSGSASSGTTSKEHCIVTVGGKGYVVDKGDTVTYTCKLETPKKIEDIQATLSYDSSYLKLKSISDEESIFPVLGLNAIYNTSLDNMVKFNAVKIAGFDFTSENTLLTLEFEVLKNGGTSVKTDIEIMTAVDGTVYADNSVLANDVVCTETLK